MKQDTRSAGERIQILTPAELGHLVGLSEQATNRELEKLGLQTWFDEPGYPPCWLLAEAGVGHGCYPTDAQTDPDVRTLLWFSSVSKLIQARAVQEHCRGAEEEDSEFEAAD